MKKISVIIPAFNSEKYLDKCIDSICNQSYSKLEIIIVNDGSTDKTELLCSDLKNKDSRIKIINKQNEGVSAARNTGIEKATGDYITFVDSDDFLEINAYERMLGIATQYNADVVLADCIKDYPDHQELYTHEIREGFYNHEQLIDEYYPHLLMMENLEYPATISNNLILCKLETIGNIRYPEGIRFSEDLLFGARMMRNANSFFYMKGKAFYHYVMNPNSVTHKHIPDKWNDYKRLHQNIIKYYSTDIIFDFSNQINLCLIFFFLNALGDIYNISTFGYFEKIKLVHNLLNDKDIVKAFSCTAIHKLPIKIKLKCELLFYKYRIFTPILTWYLSNKHLI